MKFIRSCLIIILVLLLSSIKQYSIAQATWYKYPGNPVFQPGKSGEWDEAKIANTVLFEDGKLHMWYSGWSDDKPGFIGIGYAFSPDGIHWQKYEGNPLDFTCEGTSWDTILISFDIIKKDSMYWMWYTGWDKKSSLKSVGFAWSEDGLKWTKHPEPILKAGKDDKWDGKDIQGASVHFDGIRYHMWYSGAGKKKHFLWVHRIGYATSGDGIHWKKHPANPVLDVGGPGTWDEYSMGIHSVNFNGSFYEMWYNGWDKFITQTGYATSVDGINWIKSSDNPVLAVGELGTWDTWIARIPIVLYHDSIYKMWYYGHDRSRGNIGYATNSIDEAKSWDTATIDKPQRIYKVQVFNRQEYINVDSLTGILPESSGVELIDACNKLALAYSLNESKKSLEFAEKALELSDKENYPEGRAMALYSIGNSLYILDNYSEALASHLLALWLFDSLDMQYELGNLLAQIAGIHSYAGSHDLSCRYFKQALDVVERRNDTLDIISSLEYLGYSYLEYGDTASAMKAFQRGLSLAKATRDKWIKAGSCRAMGLCYSGHNLDSALWYFTEANKLWNHAWPEGYNFLITAEAYIAAGPEYYDDAEDYLYRSFPKMSAGRQNKVRLYLGAAELFFITGRYGESKEFLDISLDECLWLLDRQDFKMFASLNHKLEVEIELKLYMEKIYRLYYRLDTVFHDKDLAFAHYMLASQWKDSIYNDQSRKQTAMMQGTYETESTQSHMGMLRKENEVKELRIQQSRILLFGLCALVLIIVLGAILFIRSRKVKAQHTLELERSKSEKLKELDHLKSQFFANISHEFRTPLTLIMGPLDRVLTRSEDENDKKELGIAKKYARNLQNLINNLLSISKLESGKMLLHSSETDIVKMVNTYIQSFESLAKQKNIALKFSSESKEIRAFIDREKFEQILNNLLSNAFKFTGSGGRIEVIVGSRQYAVGEIPENRNNTAYRLPPTVNLPEKCTVISISDTGSGIPADKLPYIFDRFYQVEQEDNSYYEGTGIGLALTKELVDLHHGDISVESKPEIGTTFTVVLPLGKEHLSSEEIETSRQLTVDSRQSTIDSWQSIPEPETRNPEPETDIDKPLLLIVEDNLDLREYIRDSLDQLYHILEAENGEEGLKRAIEAVPDLIISDVMMPKMDGYQLCQNLKTDERTSHIPIIILTARASMESRIEGLETGADDFITKPFELQELLTRIKNLLKQRILLQQSFMRNVQKMGIDQLITFDTPDLTSMDQSFLQKVTEYVIQNISNFEFNVEMLGDKMALSRRQLQRKLIGITGHSPNMFIRSVRLNRAAELLRNKAGNVTEIAYDVGFNNLSWFAKSFKEQFGVLPSEYPLEKSK